MAHNAGTRTTLAGPGFDVTGPSGFDISSTPDGPDSFDDTAYTLLFGGPCGASMNLNRFALLDDLAGGISRFSLRSFGSDEFGGCRGWR